MKAFVCPFPCPPAWKLPNGPPEPNPDPDPVEKAPLDPEAIPTPVDDPPPIPAFPVPNPAALPAAGLTNPKGTPLKATVDHNQTNYDMKSITL